LRIAEVELFAIIKETVKDFREDDLQGRAAEVTYNVLFSIVPLLIFLTAISGFVARAAGVDDSMQQITGWLFDHMGNDQARAVRDPIERVVQSSNGGLLSIGALLALWGGKNAIAAVMKGLNIAYDVQEFRPWPRRTALAIGLTVVLGFAVTLTSAVFLAGAGFATDLTDKVGLGETWRTVWSVVRWPVIAVILVAAVSALYWAAPNIEVPFKWLIPGAMLTVAFWGAATLGLGFYFAHFAGYAGGTYGALGGVLVFLFWVDVMALILLVGAEFNSVLLRRSANPAGAAQTSADHDADPPSVRSVPRGTSTPLPAVPSARARLRRPLASLLVATVLLSARVLLRLRPIATRRDSTTRHR
jgi:membrane protein